MTKNQARILFITQKTERKLRRKPWMRRLSPAQTERVFQWFKQRYKVTKVDESAATKKESQNPSYFTPQYWRAWNQVHKWTIAGLTSRIWRRVLAAEQRRSRLPVDERALSRRLAKDFEILRELGPWAPYRIRLVDLIIGNKKLSDVNKPGEIIPRKSVRRKRSK